MDQSGRQSMANFAERGTGDAVVTYENELLLRNKESEPIPYVIPARDALDREPGGGGRRRRSSRTATGRWPRRSSRSSVSDEGQRIVADYGFRPVKPDAPGAQRRMPLPAKLFTMADLGGWAKIEEELYGPKGLWTSIFAANTSDRARGDNDRWLRARSNRAAAARTSSCGARRCLISGLMVVLPLGGARDRGGPARGRRRSATAVRDPFAWHALKLTFITALVMVVVNVVHRHGDRLGAGPVRVPRQAGWSTP